MLRQRLLFGAILIAALVGLIIGDDRYGSLLSAGIRLGSRPGLLVTAVVAVLAAVGSWELSRLSRVAGQSPLLIWAIFVNVGFACIPFLLAGERTSLRALTVDRATLDWLIASFFGVCLFTAMRRSAQGALADIAATMLLILYLGLLPQFLVRIRTSEPKAGPWLLLYFVGVVKVCDIGAYFTGLRLGRRRLIPWLSPKKTVEGLVGGLAASTLVAVLAAAIVRTAAGADSPLAGAFPSPFRACLFGCIMALVGQAGDLLESLFKRDAQAKDSAHAIPAFGGVLDVIDSLLPTAPLAYWLLVQ